MATSVCVLAGPAEGMGARVPPARTDESATAPPRLELWRDS